MYKIDEVKENIVKEIRLNRSPMTSFDSLKYANGMERVYNLLEPYIKTEKDELFIELGKLYFKYQKKTDEATLWRMYGETDLYELIH